MYNILGVVFASGGESKLNELTIHRTTASLPFCSRYRLIDFTLSNCVNSGITSIGIIAKNNYSSLTDHIRQGRDWDLNRKNGGIAVFPPFVVNTSREVYKGSIEAMYTILDYITRSKADYVMISNSNYAANIDFQDVCKYHIEKGAEITVVSHKDKTASSKRMVLTIADNGKIEDGYMSEMVSEDEKDISMNIYIVKLTTLVEMVKAAYARGHVDFEKDILFRIIGAGKAYAYQLTDYSAIIDDVKSYYNESMALLDYDARQQLFRDDNNIYTKVKDSVPTRYLKNATVKNSLIADGCIIDGIVENSILFRNVKVEKGAVIKNSIIMENGHIKSDSTISYAIADKDVTVEEKRNLSGFATYPIVIVKGKVI